MTAVTYTAKRELVTGHVAETQYTIDLRCRARELDKDVGKQESRSMSGNSETVTWRNLREWSIATGALRGGPLELVTEFLESVIEGETFEFDELGQADVPDNPVTVVMDGVYRRRRAVRQGDGGRDDYFRFTFDIRQVP